MKNVSIGQLLHRDCCIKFSLLSSNFQFHLVIDKYPTYRIIVQFSIRTKNVISNQLPAAFYFVNMIHQLSFTHLFTRFYVNIFSVEAEQIDSSPLPLNFLIHLVVTITLGSVMLQLKVFVYSFISLFTYLFIHLFIYIFTHSFIYLFIYLFNSF